jgi:hypothetical protein
MIFFAGLAVLGELCVKRISAGKSDTFDAKLAKDRKVRKADTAPTS